MPRPLTVLRRPFPSLSTARARSSRSSPRFVTLDGIFYFWLFTNSVDQVNPDIVGGLIVEIADRTVDLSVSSKIAKMNKALSDAV